MQVRAGTGMSRAQDAAEAGREAAAAGSVPTFGMHCCGEFARSAGVLGTHNATLTAMAL